MWRMSGGSLTGRLDILKYYEPRERQKLLFAQLGLWKANKAAHTLITFDTVVCWELEVVVIILQLREENGG